MVIQLYYLIFLKELSNKGVPDNTLHLFESVHKFFLDNSLLINLICYCCGDIYFW